MKKPVLVVMAAGMGSRYGGLKQMDPVDEKGRVILDYSVYDAAAVGFEEVIFVIKPEMKESFEETVGKRIEGKIGYSFAFQTTDDIPEGFEVPEGRVKPWGTGHAVRAVRNLIDDRSFVVINADDFYGSEAFKKIYDFLTAKQEGDIPTYCCVAYMIENTVTENGSVARGVCRTDEEGFLSEITERTNIIKRPDGAAFSLDNGKTWTELPKGTPVSMNFWGFTPDFMKELDERFPEFLENGLKSDPLKCEYFLPFVVDEVRKEGKARVRVLYTHDKWHGVTYKEDKENLVKALRELCKERY